MFVYLCELRSGRKERLGLPFVGEAEMRVNPKKALSRKFGPECTCVVRVRPWELRLFFPTCLEASSRWIFWVEPGVEQIYKLGLCNSSYFIKCKTVPNSSNACNFSFLCLQTVPIKNVWGWKTGVKAEQIVEVDLRAFTKIAGGIIDLHSGSRFNLRAFPIWLIV